MQCYFILLCDKYNLGNYNKSLFRGLFMLGILCLLLTATQILQMVINPNAFLSYFFKQVPLTCGNKQIDWIGK